MDALGFGARAWRATRRVDQGSPNSIATLRPDSIWEGLVVLTLLLVAVVPGFVDGRWWIGPAAAMIVLAAGSCLRARRVPDVPLTCVVLVGLFVAAGLHGPALRMDDVAREVVRPLFALAVAIVITTSAQRARLLVALMAVAILQVPVTAAQTADHVVRFGRHATSAVDSVTGTLGTSQSGVATLLALLAVALGLGAWVAGVVGKWAFALIGMLVAVGVFTSTRAVIAFVPAMALAVVAVVLLSRPPRRLQLRLAGAAVVALLAAPVLYGAIDLLYPGAFASVLRTQNATVLGTAYVVAPPPTNATPTAGQKSPAVPPTSGVKLVPVSQPAGVQLLPGRFAQLRLAVRLSFDGGLATTAIGRGLGSSTLDPSIQLAALVPPPERTGSTTMGALLTDAGWVGVLAFAAFLLWLTWGGYVLWTRARSAADRALGAALPAIVALAAAGALFTTILDVRGFSLPFWLVVGVTISALRELRTEQGSRRHPAANPV